MEAALQSPPPLQSISDEDRYNAEYASIHFGSFAAPEHKIATVDDPQPPLPSNPEPQDSQSPTLQPDVIDTDKETEQEDSEDVERVEELVGGADVEGLLTLDTDIPFSADYVDDEPSSALALRISRAMDNPSPPPSPLPNEDTLPTELTEADANDNDQDLPAEDALAPPEIPPASPSPTPPQPTDSHMDVEDPVPSSPSPQQDLITFDSVSALEIPFVIKPQDDNANPPDSAISAVEAMLLPSPSDSPVDPSTSEAPIAPTVDEPETELALPHPNLAPETNGLSPPSTPPTQPLRRSPRKSVAPVIFGTPQGTPRPSSRSPKKKKPKFDLVVDNSQDESDDVTPENVLLPIQPNSTTGTPRTRERSRSRSPLVFSREVGSLSPTTSNLLTELIPSFTDTTPLQLNAEEPALSNGEPVSSQGMQTFSVFAAPPSPAPAPPSDPQPSTPTRPSAPIRPMATPSPSKLRLQVSAQDATATPARRIPIEQALESGQLSPLKASQMGFKPQSTLPGLPQTPARRVLVSEQPAQAPASAKPAIRIGSPVRGRSQEPQASTASTSGQIGISSIAQRTALGVHAVSSHSIASSSAASARPSKLPFPLVAAEKPPSASTSSDKDTSKESASISSPVKSNLKQVSSRIPRIGAKPYSRPPTAAKPTKQTPAPAPAPAPKPSSIRKVDLSKPSTTRMVASRGLASSTSTSLAKGKGKETAATTRSVAPAASATNLPSSIPSAAKRKRSPDKIPSPVKSRMPSSRQAPSLATTATAASTSRVRATAAAKKIIQPTLRIRKVVDPVPPPAPVAPPPPPVPQAQQPIQPAQPTAQMIFNKEPTQTHGEAEAAHIEVAPMPVDGGLDLGSPMKEDPPTQPLVRPLSPPAPPPVPVPSIPVIQIDPPTETPPIETLHPSEIPQPIQGVRRTTRLRKATVDCAATGAEPRATSSRRKASQGPRFVFTDAYSEMSVTALKQLTMTNTVRNQHYLSAKLELEVIKKDGARPESPMVKIKTIAQRQLEEQAEQRTERAKRRARRSGEMLGESDLEMDESDNEGYSSDVDELPSLEKEQKMRHTRGAGEDEDYETPHRAFKRMKLTEGGLEEVEMDEAKRRVKWDRGLFTTVYLDEVVLGDRQLTKEHRSLKGCLAPTAKALRLDTLGNLEADSPLSDLASQNIVVKKFVYEGELVPEPVVEEVEVPKTRSRSKKAKS